MIRTDPSNTDVVIGPEQYTPFGETGTAPTPDRVGYRAELTTAGLVNLRNRDYDPTTGQFTTQDPLDGVDGTPVVANRHHYVDNDPLNRIDPLGLRTRDEDLCNADNGAFYPDGEAGTFCHVPAGTGEDGEPCQPLRSSRNELVVVHNGHCSTFDEVVDACGRDGWQQSGADFFGGALSVLSVGLSTHSDYINGKTCGESRWYTAGNAAGVAVVVLAGVGHAAARGGGTAVSEGWVALNRWSVGTTIAGVSSDTVSWAIHGGQGPILSDCSKKSLGAGEWTYIVASSATKPWARSLFEAAGILAGVGIEETCE